MNVSNEALAYNQEVLRTVWPLMIEKLGFSYLPARGYLLFQVPKAGTQLKTQTDCLNFWNKVRKETGLQLKQDVTITFIDQEFEILVSFLDVVGDVDPEEKMEQLAKAGMDVKSIYFPGQADSLVN